MVRTRNGVEAEVPNESHQDTNGTKLSAAQKKRLKQKQRKVNKKAEREQQQQMRPKAAPRARAEEEVEIEYVMAPMDVVLASAQAGGSGDAAAFENNPEGAAAMEELARIMQRFTGEEEKAAVPAAGEGGAAADGLLAGGEEETAAVEGAKAGEEGSGDEGSEDEGEGGEKAGEKLSKKKRKEASRLKIAALKQICDRPEVVEVWDVTSADPALLVYLKSYRNTVPVPRHWSQKRKYLQGKRGLEKPPFKLPAFIEATGIGEMRQAYLEKAEAQKLKSKGRERMQPKMGKLDIDYQILHDAFFRHQTKPAISGFGELYYEGKEYEASVRHARPGVLSAELQEALGMEFGSPPPWLVSMQRYGPPPSYPSLRIPGLNAPIPPGAHFGYHQGGWGKPPVDEYGTPIYGDVFSGGAKGKGEDGDAGHLIGSHWGELEEEESSEEEESEEEGGEEEEEDEDAAFADGTASVASGIASTIPGGLETPVEVQLRKAAEEHAAAAPEAPKQLYQVLEQQKATVGAAGIMGSDHVYKVPGETTTAAGTGKGDKKVSIAAARRLEALRREMPADVDVAIDPADLEALDDEALKDLYESRVKEARTAAGREDFSDLVAAKSVTQKRKADDKSGGKEKKFKF